MSKPITVHMDDLNKYCGSDMPQNCLLVEPDEEPRPGQYTADRALTEVQTAVDSDDEGVETGGRTYPDVPTISSVVYRGKRLRRPR
ncbi:hypothetical protein LSAT2_021026 [Lamellibrachia satsuma]|nr:hypothetical protein LSAT2_021026 [Lamellibrachia satsuma]